MPTRLLQVLLLYQNHLYLDSSHNSGQFNIRRIRGLAEITQGNIVIQCDIEDKIVAICFAIARKRGSLGFFEMR